MVAAFAVAEGDAALRQGAVVDGVEPGFAGVQLGGLKAELPLLVFVVEVAAPVVAVVRAGVFEDGVQGAAGGGAARVGVADVGVCRGVGRGLVFGDGVVGEVGRGGFDGVAQEGAEAAALPAVKAGAPGFWGGGYFGGGAGNVGATPTPTLPRCGR